MKKFISMAMVAAMTTSMVPATAFAGDTVNATAGVINKWTIKDSDSKDIHDGGTKTSAPEVVVEITSASIQGTLPQTSYEYTVELDGATFDLDGDGTLKQTEVDEVAKGLKVDLSKEGTQGTTADEVVTYDYKAADATAITAYLEAVYENVVNGTAIPEDAMLYDALTATGDDLLGVAEEDMFEAVEVEDLGTVATGYAAPVAANAREAADNRDDVWKLATDGYYAKHPDLETTAAALGGGPVGATGWTYTTVHVNGEGWMYDNLFVAEEDVIEWAATQDVVLDSETKIKDTVENGAFIDTDEGPAMEKDDWVAAQSSFAAASGHSFVVVDKENVTEATTATGANRENIKAAITGWKANNPEELTITVSTAAGEKLQAGDKFTLDLTSVLDKTQDAYVSVRSDDFTVSNDREDMLYVDIEDEGLTAYTKELTTVAEEEWTQLKKDIEIKSVVGNLPTKLELQVSNGFEIRVNTLSDKSGTGYTLANGNDDDEIIVTVDPVVVGDKLVIDAEDIIIEATTADAGDIATLKVTSPSNSEYGRVNLEIAKVVDYNVILSVEEDEDVPVIYSGVNVANYGITDDSDHWTLEITAEESFPGAWSMREGFNFELPDGVYVTNVEVKEAKNFKKDNDDKVNKDDWDKAFKKAYQDGEHKNFEFKKRVFDDVNTTLAKDPAEVTFELQLVADPGFVGDVNLKLTGDLLDEQEVTIAKFATPYVVTAEQNDLKIDYRYTTIPTDIVVTETEAGLWDEGNTAAEFVFGIEDELMHFEDDPTFTIDEASNLEIKSEGVDTIKKLGGITLDEEDVVEGAITFTVDDESDEAATVTISDMQLYMNRSIPAGPYDLEMATSMGARYLTQGLYAPDAAADEEIVDDVADFSTVVKEAFVNIVTAGREQDDASFTTKVVVPVGESYIVAGENQYDLDVPAYISAAGYTMLPVRAVATALGINNNNVIWNGETKTVTILYGQRIITMVAGQKVVNVNGSVIPASAAVEIVDGRTFLPMRDLATALGVTDITWDAATKTATLNGGYVAE